MEGRSARLNGVGGVWGEPSGPKDPPDWVGSSQVPKTACCRYTQGMLEFLKKTCIWICMRAYFVQMSVIS